MNMLTYMTQGSFRGDEMMNLGWGGYPLLSK